MSNKMTAEDFISELDTKPLTHEINGKSYEIVDPSIYVPALKNSGAKQINAEKSACIRIRKGEIGEKIQVYTSNGNLEASETYHDTNNWIVTRVDLDGKTVIDKYNHDNTWQISDETLKKKYDFDNMTSDNIVKPKGGIQTFIQVDKDIAIMVPWGENGSLIPQVIDKNGYLNITKPEDIYGIAAEEFAETYAVKSDKSVAHKLSSRDKLLAARNKQDKITTTNTTYDPDPTTNTGYDD